MDEYGEQAMENGNGKKQKINFYETLMVFMNIMIYKL